MSNQELDAANTLGFLTVVEHPEHGLFGGYLILNRAGRPLEFHCTTPLKPTRAQQILYGATLEAFLYGEQIGQTLIAQSKRRPDVVCTDQGAAMAVRELIEVPTLLVVPGDAEATTASDGDGVVDAGEAAVAAHDPAYSGRQWRLDRPHSGAPKMHAFVLGRQRLAVCDRFRQDADWTVAHLVEVSETLDLAEPFERIRAAIEEAQRGAR